MTQVDPVTDRRHLTSKTYATGAAGLDVRIETHQRYTRPQVDFAQWILEQIRWHGDEVVLDVGCGSGLYVDPVLDSELVFPQAEPAVAYINSMRDAFEPQLPRGLQWEALIDRVGYQIEAVVTEQGAYHVPKRSGALIAQKDGLNRKRIEH
jgi:hypothetical protein